jgi:enoyl-CoA hydratase
LFDPHVATEAGLLDTVVAPEELGGAARRAALDLREVDRRAHAATKLRVRQRVLDELRGAIEDELRTGHPPPAGA